MCVSHNIRVSHQTEENGPLRHDKFSSMMFTKTYMNASFPQSAIATTFHGTHQHTNKLRRAVKDCMEYVNANGGWTVIGWYRCGMVNDQILVGNPDILLAADETTMFGDITHHIVQIIPTDADFKTNKSAKSLVL